MIDLADELKQDTYDAIINPDNPNFNRDITNSLLQQYYALDFKKTYDSVRNTDDTVAQPKTIEQAEAGSPIIEVNIPKVKIL